MSQPNAACRDSLQPTQEGTGRQGRESQEGLTPGRAGLLQGDRGGSQKLMEDVTAPEVRKYL